MRATTQDRHRTKKITGISLGLLVGVALLVSVILPFLSPHHTLPKTISKFSTQVKPSVLSASTIEICTINKNTSSLVYDVTDTGKVITGQYRGTIHSLTKTQQDTGTTIDIITDNGQETYAFSIGQEVLAFDAIHAKKMTMHDLQIGDYVGITFNCNKAQANQFKIVSIGIIPK